MCYQSEGLGIDPQCCPWGFFPKLPTEPCALGSIQPLKISTRNTPGDKDGQCVKVTTLPPSQCRKSRKSWALTYRVPKGLFRPVAGNLYLWIIWTILAMYIWRNIEARSCVLALVIRHAHSILSEPLWLYHSLPYHLINVSIFEKRKLLNIKRVLIFSTTSIWNISHCKKNSARYKNNTQVFMYSIHYSCQKSIKLEISRQTFAKSPNIKFHENSFSGSLVVFHADRQTNSHVIDSRSLHLRTRIKRVQDAREKQQEYEMQAQSVK
jgi:hypothetical protein